MIETIEEVRELIQDKIKEHNESANKGDIKLADHVNHRNQIAHIGAVATLELLLEEIGE